VPEKEDPGGKPVTQLRIWRFEWKVWMTKGWKRKRVERQKSKGIGVSSVYPRKPPKITQTLVRKYDNAKALRQHRYETIP
jgi:hypothetical protein